MQCRLCPLACGADRTSGAGACGAAGLSVAKYCLHPYEEPCLARGKGSGAVFFAGCSLRCVFCQNYAVSRAEKGRAVSPRELAEIMKRLEDAGAENIDLVTPDHVSHLIGEALALYKPHVPVVYNSSGYALVPALRAIEPYVDVWMPDLKFCSPTLSARYTGRGDYFDVASRAIGFMAKKPLKTDSGGKLLSGILVRHLVLPACTADSKRALDYLRKTLPAGAPLSLMRQYTPMGEIENFPELQRKITDREYSRVADYALALGFEHIYLQEKESADPAFIPVWDG